MSKRFQTVVVFSALAAAYSPASAGDMTLPSDNGDIFFSGSYGLTSLRANEFVWDGSTKVSQLKWRSSFVSTFTGDFKAELPRDWYINARATVGVEGDGFMADYDWLAPGLPWTHRSQHPDTRLNHYLAGGAEIGRQVLSYDETDLSLGAGFKYTDVKWTAWGGSYIYSVSGFRDSHGNFPDDEKGISYRQSWPVPYIGANISHTEGAWTVSGSLQAGVAVDAYGTDDHWMRDLRFYDYYFTRPAISGSVMAVYQIRDNMRLFVSGSFEKMFEARADTKEIDKNTGGIAWYKDGAGGDFRSATISMGLKASF